jgi:hypothetical protein
MPTVAFVLVFDANSIIVWLCCLILEIVYHTVFFVDN